MLHQFHFHVCIYKSFPKYECSYKKHSKNIKHAQNFALKLGLSIMFPIM